MHIIDQIVFLICAHFIADWGIWNSWMAANKGKYWIVMLAHCLIYTGVCCATFYFIGITPIAANAAILLITHYIIDQWKCNSTKLFPSWHLYVDQAAHIAILLGMLLHVNL